MSESIQSLPGWCLSCSIDGGLKDCSLIIATYSRPQELLLLLEVLIGLPDPPAEVVVVDGDPPDDHELRFYSFLKDYRLPFNFIYVKSPKGLTRQRNVGIDISSQAYVFFLDDDCLPQPGYFQETQKVFLEDTAEKVGAICGLNINEIDRPLVRRWRLRLALGLVSRNEPKIYQASGTSIPINSIKPFVGVRQVDILNGNAMAFRRTVLNENRFSAFFHGYSWGEDLEISLRVRRKWQILWCGDARVVHNHAAGGRPPSFAKGVMEVRNRYFIRNRYSKPSDMQGLVKFWLDMAFLITMDLAWFVCRPWRPHFFLHAVGLAWGNVVGLIAPPTFEEPPAGRQYEIRLDNFTGK